MTENPILMKAKVKCVAIKKKSQSPAFKGIEVGDIISLTLPIEYNIRQTASYIACVNERTKEQSCLSQKQLWNIMRGFEFKEI